MCHTPHTEVRVATNLDRRTMVYMRSPVRCAIQKYVSLPYLLLLLYYYQQQQYLTVLGCYGLNAAGEHSDKGITIRPVIIISIKPAAQLCAHTILSQYPALNKKFREELIAYFLFTTFRVFDTRTAQKTPRLRPPTHVRANSEPSPTEGPGDLSRTRPSPARGVPHTQTSLARWNPSPAELVRVWAP
jgi:hypothetical protein